MKNHLHGIRIASSVRRACLSLTLALAAMDVRRVLASSAACLTLFGGCALNVICPVGAEAAVAITYRHLRESADSLLAEINREPCWSSEKAAEFKTRVDDFWSKVVSWHSAQREVIEDQYRPMPVDDEDDEEDLPLFRRPRVRVQYVHREEAEAMAKAKAAALEKLEDQMHALHENFGELEQALENYYKKPTCGQRSQRLLPGGFFVDVYGGMNLGYVSQSGMDAFYPGFGFTPLDAAAVNALSTATLIQTGVAVGMQAGLDVLWNQFLFGVATDWTFKGGDPTRITVYASPAGGRFPMTQNFASSFEVTVRGRVGYEFPLSPGFSVVPYATAGLALSQMSVSDGMYFPTSFNYGASSQFKSGWAAGGGVEFRTKSPFRVQLQYLHSDFGNIDYTMPNTVFPTSFIATHHQMSEDRATVGVNVSFSDLPRLLNGRF